jgi:uncharacterized membrane protein required for colicin V production
MIKSISAFIVFVATLVVAAIVISKMLGELISDGIRGIDR